MRTIDIGSKKHTKVVSVDEMSFGAHHEYHIIDTSKPNEDEAHLPTCVKFQKGPVKEHGINGCHNEDLIAIVLDRLECFQNTEYKCRENALAITKLEEAMMWLRKRTQDRENRGVEGTSEK